MASAGVDPEGGLLGAIRKRWRGWLRAIHRDIGYLVVGLTVVYAISGLAINHIGTEGWDPNYRTYERERTIEPIPAELDDEAALARAREVLGVGAPRSYYRAGDELHLEYDYRQIVIIGDKVVEQGRKPRFFLRVANWLHYNRGKKAWTYVADAYAVLLLYLAVSGLFMIKGKKGLRWRGACLAAAGIAVPIVYVVWSGGPEAAARRGARDAPAATGAPPSPAPPPSPSDEPGPPPSSGGPDDFPRMQPRPPSGSAGELGPPPSSGEPDDFPRMQPRPPSGSAGELGPPPASGEPDDFPRMQPRPPSAPAPLPPSP